MSSTTASPHHDDAEELVNGFVHDLADRVQVERQVQTFCLQHASHHRPIVLVSSGGTAADLEIHSVRCLENFSTGTRGAASVEAFLRKGYAVIHLWRTGSSSPYGRRVAEAIGLGGHEGISNISVGKIFVGAGDLEAEEEDQMVQSVLNQDPWMTEPPTNASMSSTTTKNKTASSSSSHSPIALHRRVEGSSRLQTALKERQTALEEGRLSTVPFRSIEEYLAKLQLCTLALRDSQALAMVYLAAAVSDFYVPLSHRSQHKIQSMTAGGGLTLTLEPVPKVLGLLRSQWAPDAFVCSFKLETDPTLLRQKAELAVKNYGCHMVVGNILETRYSEVSVLVAPSNDDDNESRKDPRHQWSMQTLRKSSDPDSLENQLVDVVIQEHFNYISKSCHGTFDKAGMDAVMKAHEEMNEKKRRLERKIFWEKVQTSSLDWAGVAAGALLSYVVSSALRKRMGVS